ncbi:TniQ family protein [Jhaorihella thermophila]
MTLLPVLPVLSGESLTSYVNRAAYAHGNIDIFRFLSFLELPQGAIMSPKSDQLDRIAQLFGLPVEQLGRMAFLPEGGRMRSICGERVHAEFAYLNKTSYCPACLLADADPCGPSHGRRVGRIAWQIEAVRTCPHHGIALFRRKNTDHSENLQIMSRVAPGDAELREQVHASMRRMPSNLQTYIERRLSREIASLPGWTVSRSISHPAPAKCWASSSRQELIATCARCVMTNGTRRGTLGIPMPIAGRQGSSRRSKSCARMRSGAVPRAAPQKVLGRLYQWLQFNKNNKPHGPIQGVVREYILNHFSDRGRIPALW